MHHWTIGRRFRRLRPGGPGGGGLRDSRQGGLKNPVEKNDGKNQPWILRHSINISRKEILEELCCTSLSINIYKYL